MEKDKPSSGYPRTVDEAVGILCSEMTAEDISSLKSMSKSDLLSLHMTAGMGIRNRFGLWDGNTDLLLDCYRRRIDFWSVYADEEELDRPHLKAMTGECDDPNFPILYQPDEASGVIIREVWKRVKFRK